MNIYSLEKLINHSQQLPKCILTIGNFDGVHLGHQAMLHKLCQTAKAQNFATAVMIFEPQPREFFDPNNAPPRLTNCAEKLALLQDFGIQNVIIAEFNDAFRNLSADEFATILRNIGVCGLVLGDDFRFGHDRVGDSNFLQNAGFFVSNLDTVENREYGRISSTKVREFLLNGDLSKAKQILGRDYAMTGEVLHGDKIGRTLNFPTANVALNRIKPALQGVFAVDATLNNKQNFAHFSQNQQNGLTGFRPNSLFGTASIGIRPSVAKPHDWRLEIFFPNFQGNLYGQVLNVRFLYFLHAERDYQNLAALQIGIANDVKALLAWRDQALLLNNN
ncbi:riboflavin biosynthesis protein RibF [Moraxella macacae 0408225]|uniref:Riboflavin biosynthesis protein n=1 Tax=Moraxella macacae 0408225 TaxID=1230338 RepID=L2F8Y5_9GAMM|nr:riboflavin biosynthesis protein RibF [Moraxella macacae]ELA08933.1 riboflavin biosynthesis protein RibF [Moraxella macacae 0408225]